MEMVSLFTVVLFNILHGVLCSRKSWTLYDFPTQTMLVAAFYVWC